MVPGILITMKHSDTIEKLLVLADHDLGLLQTAIRQSVGEDGKSKLEDVVHHICVKRGIKTSAPKLKM